MSFELRTSKALLIRPLNELAAHEVECSFGTVLLSKYSFTVS